MSQSAIPTPSTTDRATLFAPGHLGELTPNLPPELVDDILEQTRTTQHRLRQLPSRVGIYFVLALSLFPHLGITRVWDKLTGGLTTPHLPRPTDKALRDLRRRLGPAPLKAVFEVIAGPLAWPTTPGVTYHGLRTVAFDGCHSLKTPDTPRTRAWLGRIHYRLGFAGYPTLHLMTLVETGTRALLAATLGGQADRDELTLATRLLPHLHTGMLLLTDRAFDANAFLAGVRATGAHLLARAKNTRNPPVRFRLPDGSYLSWLEGLRVRVIDAHLSATGHDGSHVTDRYRLITTLLDPHHYPATELIQLYHERWEIEIAYLGLRHTLLDGHPLRSGDQPGLEQETWALLTLYQLLRHVMVTATSTQPGIDPDRACFTTAREAARDHLIRGTTNPDPTDLLGGIGRQILATLLPARRLRFSARKVKCATSRYLRRADHRPEASTSITLIQLTICPPPATTPARPRPHQPRPHRPRSHRPRSRSGSSTGQTAGPTSTPTRRDRVLEVMRTYPDRAWSGRDLATELSIPARNLLTQLAEWSRLGFLSRVSTGCYALRPSS